MVDIPTKGFRYETQKLIDESFYTSSTEPAQPKLTIDEFCYAYGIKMKVAKVKDNPYLPNFPGLHYTVTLTADDTNHKMVLLYSKAHVHKGELPRLDEVIRRIQSDINAYDAGVYKVKEQSNLHILYGEYKREFNRLVGDEGFADLMYDVLSW